MIKYQPAWLRQLLPTFACLWWRILRDRIGVYCIASQPCLGPQDYPVMSFLYCLQDIIYKYGDDTYPTTGKQDKAWLNKPISLTCSRQHWRLSLESCSAHGQQECYQHECYYQHCMRKVYAVLSSCVQQMVDKPQASHTCMLV